MKKTLARGKSNSTVATNDPNHVMKGPEGCEFLDFHRDTFFIFAFPVILTS
ncbi:MAG: hypothetical protein ACLGJC_18350 [Alphaproteobacteria bacterium]